MTKEFIHGLRIILVASAILWAVILFGIEFARADSSVLWTDPGGMPRNAQIYEWDRYAPPNQQWGRVYDGASIMQGILAIDQMDQMEYQRKLLEQQRQMMSIMRAEAERLAKEREKLESDAKYEQEMRRQEDMERILIRDRYKW